jgi:serine/threonine protein kinase/tetratricopeptide (TPR) repeat protein
MPPAKCPSHDTLRAFQQGCVSDTCIEEITAHLTSGCRDCHAVLEDLEKQDDSFRDLLRRYPFDLQNDESADSEGESSPSNGANKLPRVGERVAGYEILEVLGSGGMGVVYKAQQLSANRVVALKMILAGQFASEIAVRRFLAEAKAAARLDHPHLVPVYDVGAHEGQPYYSMKFIDGGNLAKKIGGTPLPPTEAAQLVEVLSQGIHYAHEHSVVHRDLKPANVLLTKDGLPLIADFGLAKKEEGDKGLTHSGAIMGTPSYMAPEQASGDAKDIGPLTDVYALGSILYECLTGRPPFKGATPMDTLWQVRTDDPVSVRQLQPTVPRDLETICHYCLSKLPAKRYGSAKEVGEDLRRYLDGRPIKARPVGLPAQIWRWCRRKPALAGLIVALVLVVSIGIGSVVSLWWQAAESERRARESEKNAVERRRQAEAAQQDAEQQQATTVRLLTQVSRFAVRMSPRENSDQNLTFEMMLAIEAQYRSLLAKRPEDVDLWLELAIICHEQGIRFSIQKQMNQAQQSGQRAEQAMQQVMRLRRIDQPDDFASAELFQLLEHIQGVAQEPAAALSNARRAAAFSARAAQSPPRDMDRRFNLAKFCLALGHDFRGMGAFGDALQQVEIGKQLHADLAREAPKEIRFAIGLRDACYELGKVRWKLEQYDNALFAYREAVQAQRQAFDLAPEVPAHRQELSHFSERLAYWLRQRGRLAEASDCYLEQKKLWPGNAKRLLEIAGNLVELADEVGGGRVELTPAEQEERQRYLDLSKQVAKEAVVPQSKSAGTKP